MRVFRCEPSPCKLYIVKNCSTAKRAKIPQGSLAPAFHQTFLQIRIIHCAGLLRAPSTDRMDMSLLHEPLLTEHRGTRGHARCSGHLGAHERGELKLILGSHLSAAARCGAWYPACLSSLEHASLAERCVLHAADGACVTSAAVRSRLQNCVQTVEFWLQYVLWGLHSPLMRRCCLSWKLFPVLHRVRFKKGLGQASKPPDESADNDNQSDRGRSWAEAAAQAVELPL